MNNHENLNLEIIMIDNNSNNGTKEILQDKIKNKVSQIIFNDSDHGKGYYIKKSIENVKRDVILIQDANLKYDPKEYHKLIKPIIDGNADIVLNQDLLAEIKGVFDFFGIQ